MRKIIGLSVLDRERLPVPCAGCMYWESADRLPFECGARCDEAEATERVRVIADAWGECGRVVVEDGEVLGFIKYAPPLYMPQARHLPPGPPDGDAPLITCMHIDPDARQKGVGGLLLRAAMRDLAQRGERTVQAYATTYRGDMSDVPVVGVEFLLRHGFTVARPHPEVPLMRVDLKTLVSWTENLEAVLESLRLPVRAPRREPVTLSKADR
ncbi:MAG: GNAT family N-acetyltransferase [Coriobacteriia bacterium]|nr:GNAT family N-acetyltransferase [Coriobacteriia bacterium]MBN2839435.1 GNAT family N-acetyltransferase [Coriobacteriia bacterium]